MAGSVLDGEAGVIRAAAPPPESRCKRTRCIRRAVAIEGKSTGLCSKHFMKKPLLNGTPGGGGSKPERDRRTELHLLLGAGLIRNLREQTPWPFYVNGVYIDTWKSDYDYEDSREGWALVVEDTKGGLLSDRHVLMMRLMRACHGITVREIDMRTGRARGRKVRRIR